MEDNYIYNPKKLIKYAKDGNFVESGSIEFTPPNMDILDDTSDLEQLCMGSMMSAAKNAPKKDKDEDEEDKDEKKKIETPSPSDIKSMLLSSQDIKFKDIIKIFKKIAYKTGKLDEKTLLNDTIINKMTPTDFKDMMCGYISVFIFPSLLQGE